MHESDSWKIDFFQAIAIATDHQIPSRLPPLTALRAFESAARNQSFTKAAQELYLTQSAISRHIRSLEDFFGVALFYRDHRAVTLTPNGEAYMREVVEAFARINLATRRLKASGRQNILNLQAYSTFAMYWLIPRLGKFQEINPEVDVRLTASVAPLDFEHSDIHASIRTVTGAPPEDIRGDKLFEYKLIAVARPDAAKMWRLREPDDLSQVNMLHSLARPEDWGVWLASAGATNVSLGRGMKFESSAMAYRAAELGLGVAIAQSFLIQDELRKGSLAQVLDHAAPSERKYYLLSSPRHYGNAALELFRSWLLSELTIAPTA